MAQCFCEGSSEMLYRRLHSARRNAKDTLLTEYGLQNLGQPMLLSILRQKPDGTADSQRELAEQLLETGHSTLIRFAPVSDEDDEVDE